MPIRTAITLIITALIVGTGLGQTKLKPAAPAGSAVWTKKVALPNTPPKANRVRNKPRPKLAPLLTLQWRLLKEDADGPSEVNPTSAFYTGDKLRMEIKTNQDGYLYVINQTGGADGELLFPNSRINNGENYVKKNVPYAVPSNCPEYGDRGCWWEMDDQAGNETFLIIFSRDLITTLPNTAVDVAGVIKSSVIRSLVNESVKGQYVRLGRSKTARTDRYVKWVTNNNRKDNDELIETVVITHNPRPTAALMKGAFR